MHNTQPGTILFCFNSVNNSPSLNFRFLDCSETEAGAFDNIIIVEILSLKVNCHPNR